MALQNNVPPPLGDPMVKLRRPEFKGRDPQEGFPTDPWVDYFTSLVQSIEKATARISSVSLANQAASIGATDLMGGTLTAGLYRVNYYVRVSTAALGSSVIVAIDWQDRGVTRTRTGITLDGSLTSSFESVTFMVAVDALSPVRYATTYVAGAGMQYDLDVVLEEVRA